MKPRLEYALSAGGLALVLALLVGCLFGAELDEVFLWLVSAAAGIAALLSALWVGRWRWLVGPGHRSWRSSGLAFFTVSVALAAFFLLCMGGFAVGVSGNGAEVRPMARLGVLVGTIGVYFGTLPALLLTLPLAWRFLRRRNREAAA